MAEVNFLLMGGPPQLVLVLLGETDHPQPRKYLLGKKINKKAGEKMQSELLLSAWEKEVGFFNSCYCGQGHGGHFL